MTLVETEGNVPIQSYPRRGSHKFQQGCGVTHRLKLIGLAVIIFFGISEGATHASIIGHVQG
jgi:hypothetical protein